ncbi:MAG: hypothetical protein OGM09_13220 [Fusobacterium varium]|uniref:hypothetical protein n=1 Tax=Fusobacterium varium TaxID=856 RepID=UPI002430B36A|nr:hypothetical protein [Fusobacterium varium]UYI78105.1 MAG: hypothetical protein OGM09_13220 [Fusobacterium varium]
MGSIYKLNIKMPKEDLMLLNSIDKKVVLVKENSESSGNSNGFIDEVAWVTFQLWGDNKVTWENKYSVYVSETQKQSRAVIEKASWEEAEPKTKMYSFNNGYFMEEEFSGKSPPTAYYVKNNYYKPETFGLAQSVKVGEKLYEANPINAMTVLNNEQAYFIPVEKIKVFLAARAENGKVISVAQSQALLLDFTEKPEITITYDRSTSKFITVEEE